MAVADNPTDAIYLALRHPIRRKILAMLWRSEQPISPSDMSDLLGIPLSNVSYHVRLLHEECELLTLADKEPVRGSIRHSYAIDQERMETFFPWAEQMIEGVEVPLPVPGPKIPIDVLTFNRYSQILSDAERRLIEHRKGWNGREQKSREAIAGAANTSIEQVRLLERGALNKIAKARYEDGRGIP